MEIKMSLTFNNASITFPQSASSLTQGGGPGWFEAVVGKRPA